MNLQATIVRLHKSGLNRQQIAHVLLAAWPGLGRVYTQNYVRHALHQCGLSSRVAGHFQRRGSKSVQWEQRQREKPLDNV